MNLEQTPPSNSYPPVVKTKKSLSPLALVLILSAAFFAVFLMISGAMLLYKSPTKTKAGGSASLFSKGSVGVIELNGVIMDSKKILKTLERFEENDEIKAVVLRLNSPGGAVAPSQEIYEAVRSFKKPLIVSMGSVAASGAFYIACGAKKIFSNPGSIVGSIGVIMEFMNLSKLYEWAKVQRYSIKTGKFKDTGAEYRDMNPEERQLLQTMVDDVLLQFKKAVAAGRKLSLEEVTKIADGRIFSGNQAKELKLVDELGTLQDAIDDAARMAKIKGKPTVIYPDRSKSQWFMKLLDDSGREDSSESETKTGLVGKLMREVLGEGSDGATIMTPGIYWIWGGAR